MTRKRYNHRPLKFITSQEPSTWKKLPELLHLGGDVVLDIKGEEMGGAHNYFHDIHPREKLLELTEFLGDAALNIIDKEIWSIAHHLDDICTRKHGLEL